MEQVNRERGCDVELLCYSGPEEALPHGNVNLTVVEFSIGSHGYSAS